MNVLEKFSERQVAKLSEQKSIPEFAAGDTVRVNVRIIEGTTERIQAFEGVCIARKNRGLQSSFTVRKISHGEGVERIFSLYSPRIESVKLVRRGDVRRAKLYYMRDLSGKAARIKEKRDFEKAIKGVAEESAEPAVATELPVEEQNTEAQNPPAKAQEKAEKPAKEAEDKK